MGRNGKDSILATGLQSDVLDLRTAGEPHVVAFQSGLADGVELVEESGHEASRAPDVLLRRGVLSGDLEHKYGRECGEEFVGSMCCQEAAGDNTDSAAGLLSSVTRISKGKD